MYNVKQYDPPIDGTVACFWCGCTNHADRLKTISFFKVDGVMGCAPCWNVVKYVTNYLGITDDKTEMRKIVQLLKRARGRLS